MGVGRDEAKQKSLYLLFDLPEVRDLSTSPKWLPMRAAFVAATVGPRGRA